jgi:hypothetical protein
MDSSPQKVFEDAADMDADIESDEEVSAKMLSEQDDFDQVQDVDSVTNNYQI